MTPWHSLGRGHRTVAPGLTGGAGLVQKLLAAVKKRNIPIFYEHKAVQLITGKRAEVLGV